MQLIYLSDRGNKGSVVYIEISIEYAYIEKLTEEKKNNARLRNVVPEFG